MLKKHTQFFENLLLIIDLILIEFSWLIIYYVRFYSGLVPIEKGIPPFNAYSYLIIPILFIWSFIFKAFGLYRPRRIGTHLGEIFDVTKACTLSVFILISFTFFFRQYEYSRLIFLFFWIMTIITMNIERFVFRELLRYFRKKGYNLRHVVILGTGGLAQDLLQKIDLHHDLGIKVIGFLSPDKEPRIKELNGLPVLGGYNYIKTVINEREIDQIIIALPVTQHHITVEILKELGDEMLDIKVVPDIFELMTLRGGVEELDGIPIITLQDSPLYGWNVVLKRALDITASLFVIIVAAPLMFLIALLIKLGSHGTVFYRQERMGLDGRTFNILKFRSMRVDAEAETGGIWAKENDSRRTPLGAFIRKTSLDELPQFFNVLKGDMSIVGPRPERPIFIEEFRKAIPKYMLRHKMKAGITGWAQVNGWRGNTDLNKRIDFDLYYIENWTLGFDLKIMWLTVWKGLVHKNAY